MYKQKNKKQNKKKRTQSIGKN